MSFYLRSTIICLLFHGQCVSAFFADKTTDAPLPAFALNGLVRTVGMTSKTMTHHGNGSRPILLAVT